ncbi:MAG: MIP/aquaporin family protein [Synoicihabitans sp.]
MSTRESPSLAQQCAAEILGTFLLVLFGCGSVCAAVLTGAQMGLFQVAIVWGLGIAFAIQLTGSISGAHLNPAVTLGFTVWGDFPKSKIVPYVLAQFAGAMIAAGALLVLFGEALTAFEQAQGIVRGTTGSEASAMILTEFFPNPGGRPLAEAAFPMTELRAMGAEIAGTAVLMLIILSVTNANNNGAAPTHAPWTIGLTITVLISLLAPLTMAGFNPARDLGPRLVAAMAGWGGEVFRANGSTGWFTVYVLSPILGAQLGGFIYTRVLASAYRPKHRE